jgi:hypothetical protein
VVQRRGVGEGHSSRHYQPEKTGEEKTGEERTGEDRRGESERQGEGRQVRLTEIRG